MRATICIIRADGAVEFPEVEADFDAVKTEAGIGWAQLVPVSSATTFALVDEEGRLKGMPLNELASLLFLIDIVGPVAICGGTVDEIVSVPEAIANVVRKAHQRY